jgi:signal peptidase I
MEWLRALPVALVLLGAFHYLGWRTVRVESTSMYATLLPGDLVLVERWPLWTGFARNDVAVFHDPLKDNLPRWRRPLLVKRLVGMPGDTLELRRGRLFVNGVAVSEPPGVTHAWLVRVREGHDADSLVRALGLPESMAPPGRRYLELPLNNRLAALLERHPAVSGVERMGTATGAPRHIFPFSERYRWNSDDYGPVRVPAKGDTLRITVDNLPLYDRLLARYEDRTLSVSGSELTLDGAPLREVVLAHDYYFTLGDARHHSADSRYWGFLPQHHLVGRAGRVLRSNGDALPRSGGAPAVP